MTPEQKRKIACLVRAALRGGSLTEQLSADRRPWFIMRIRRDVKFGLEVPIYEAERPVDLFFADLRKREAV